MLHQELPTEYKGQKGLLIDCSISSSINYENIFQKGIQNNVLYNIRSTYKHCKNICSRIQNSINTVGVLFTSSVQDIKLFTYTP